MDKSLQPCKDQKNKMRSNVFFRGHLCIEDYLFWNFVGLRKVFKSSNLSPPTNFMSFEDSMQKLCVL